MNKIRISGQFFNEYLTIDRELPASWPELNEKQLNDVVEVLTSEVDPTRHLEMIAYRWIHLPAKVYFNLDPLFRKQLALTCSFIFGENTLSKVLVKEFTHGKRTFFGPEDGLLNISFIEWIMGETYLKKYQETEDEKFLDVVTYCMYRPNRTDITIHSPEYNGDLRVPLNQYNIEQMADICSDLPKKLKMLALITLIGNRNTVIKRFEAVFKDAEEKGVTDIYGWSGTIRDMADGRYSEDFKIEQEKAYKIFISWHKNILRLEEFEEQLEDAKTK